MNSENSPQGRDERRFFLAQILTDRQVLTQRRKIALGSVAIAAAASWGIPTLIAADPAAVEATDRRNPAGQLTVDAYRLTDTETVTRTRRFTGELVPRRTTRLAFELAGKVEMLAADDGDRVTEGGLLARLDTAQLAARRAELVAERAVAKARLVVFGHPFGFMAIVGTMGLLGVAINDTIVVLAAIRENDATRAGDRVAVRNVVVRASQHVISTTVTTIAGFLPLVISGGDFWPPLVTAIAGGVVGATVLALYFAPALYCLIMTPRPVRAGQVAASAVVEPAAGMAVAGA